MAKKTKKPSEELDEFIESEVEELNELKNNRTRLTKEELIPTGSTMLDLELSGTIYGGILTGKFYHMVGGSTSGKTMQCLHISANIVMIPKYDKWEIIWDEPEDGNEIDMVSMFGPKTASRIIAPKYDDNGKAIYSITVEDFYDTLTKLLDEVEAGKRAPFFYFLDSMDALTSEADNKKMYENMDLRDNGKDAGGSYGMGKASVNSKRLGAVRNRCRDLNCTLFIISQERDDISFGKPPGSVTCSGGKALKFYADAQIWFRHAGVVEQQIKGKKRVVSNKALISLMKNRLTGRKAKKIPLEISNIYGIDNISTNVDYLIEEGVWSKSGQYIKTNDTLGIEIGRKRKADLCIFVDTDEHEAKIISLIQETFDEIKELIKTKNKRRKRYN